MYVTQKTTGSSTYRKPYVEKEISDKFQNHKINKQARNMEIVTYELRIRTTPFLQGCLTWL